jgi:hypothetical protein
MFLDNEREKKIYYAVIPMTTKVLGLTVINNYTGTVAVDGVLA